MSLRLENTQLPLTSFTLAIDAIFDSPVTGVFGPSGAGKTSLLDLIAGLRRPLVGKVKLGDTLLSDTSAGLHLPPRLRRVGYVPQDLSLFPHLNVRSNLLYGHLRSGAADGIFTLEHVTEVMSNRPAVISRVTSVCQKRRASWRSSSRR